MVRSSSLSRMPVEHELFWPIRASCLSCSLSVDIGADHRGCSHIHILGSVQNIKIARDAVVSLILGSPPGMIILVAHGRRHSLMRYSGKVYAHLKAVGARMKQRF